VFPQVFAFFNDSYFGYQRVPLRYGPDMALS